MSASVSRVHDYTLQLKLLVFLLGKQERVGAQCPVMMIKDDLLSTVVEHLVK